MAKKTWTSPSCASWVKAVPPKPIFRPSRLTLARQRRGMTMTDLSAESGVSAKTISDLERGKKQAVAPETIEKIAAVLLFPVEYFFMGEPPAVTPESVSFRSLARMSARNRDQSISAVSSAIELDNWIEKRFSRPAAAVPDLRGQDPAAAAEAVRAEWGLGLKPIANMIHLLESKGVRVYSLAHKGGDMDAVSLWFDEKPFVFLNTLGTAERSRYDAAHELGHLVLHRHGGPEGQDAEREANRFAGAFLMPRADVLANAPRRPTLATIISSKGRWGVSAMALVYRLNELGLLTEWVYRQLCIRIRKQFGNAEPYGVPRESSQVLNKVFAALRETGVSIRALARELRTTPEDLSEIVFSLTMLVPIPGGSRGVADLSKRPELKVI